MQQFSPGGFSVALVRRVRVNPWRLRVAAGRPNWMSVRRPRRTFHRWMTAPARRAVVRVAASRKGALATVSITAGFRGSYARLGRLPGGSSSDSNDSRLDGFEALADIGVILGEETAVLRLVGGAAVAPVRPPGLASKADGIEGRVDKGPFRFALRRSLPSVCCVVGCPSRPLELLTGPDDGNHLGHQFGDFVGVLRAQHPHVSGVAL